MNITIDIKIEDEDGENVSRHMEIESSLPHIRYLFSLLGNLRPIAILYALIDHAEHVKGEIEEAAVISAKTHEIREAVRVAEREAKKD